MSRSIIVLLMIFFILFLPLKTFAKEDSSDFGLSELYEIIPPEVLELVKSVDSNVSAEELDKFLNAGNLLKASLNCCKKAVLTNKENYLCFLFISVALFLYRAISGSMNERLSGIANIAVITAREKELSAAFELKAQERKSELEKELSQMINTAKLKSDSMALAAQDSVEKQQLLFDKLKMEVAAFKAGVTAKYKEHLEILSSLPDSVPTDPKYIAQIVATAVDKTPDPLEFVKEAMKVPVMTLQEDTSSDDDTKPFSVNEDDDE